MLSETPVAMAISFGPPLVVTRPTTSVGSIECISRGMLSVFTFHSNFMFLTFSVVRIFSSFCHAVRWGLPPSVNQSDPTATIDPNINPKRISSFRIATFLLEPVSQRQDRATRIDLRTCDRSELCSAIRSCCEVQIEGRIRIAGIEMVQGVERFDPELERLGLLPVELLRQR